MSNSNVSARPIIKSVEPLQKIVTFICYEPNTADAHGEWMSAETLFKACEDFNFFLSSGVVVPNLFHWKDSDGVAEATNMFSIVKSFIIPVDAVIGETEVKEGTWLVKVQFHDDMLWDLFLQGEVSGISIGAQGKVGK